ncbi:MAG TPA: DsrE family protein [Saprospiraceae bacterium]|nr:DsrE family protein [Saprospiraceae bacterium]HNT20111.1 DsrE family protein [Saprospiraceae bacterium]
MKNLFVLICFNLVLSGLSAQVMLHPAIKNFGAMYDVPFGKDKPDPSIDYKIIVDLGEKMEAPGQLYAPLEHISRMYNLHIYGGIPKNQLHVAVAIWGPSIAVVMDNETYKKKYGVDNLNLQILREMKEAGIHIYGCGQSVAKFGLDPVHVNPDVEISISRFTTVSTHQMHGYAVFHL